MDTVRILLATGCFFAGLYLGYDLLVNGFNGVILAACLGALAAAHYVWPKDDQREDNPWVDWLEMLIDMPYRIAAAAVKALTRLARGDGPDVDL